MAIFRKKTSSSDVAVERLKLVLIHDRLGTSPNSNIINLIKKDIIDVISNYVEIDVENFEVEITKIPKGNNSYESRLVANIPIKKIKQSGRDSF